MAPDGLEANDLVTDMLDDPGTDLREAFEDLDAITRKVLKNQRLRQVGFWAIVAGLTASGVYTERYAIADWWERHDQEMGADNEELRFLNGLRNLRESGDYSKLAAAFILDKMGPVMFGVTDELHQEFSRELYFEVIKLKNTPGTPKDIINLMLQTGNADYRVEGQPSVMHLLTLEPIRGQIGGNCAAFFSYYVMALTAIYPDIEPYLRPDARTWKNEQGEYDAHLSLCVDAYYFGETEEPGLKYYKIDGQQISLMTDMPTHADQSLTEFLTNEALKYGFCYSRAFTKLQEDDIPPTSRALANMYDPEAELAKTQQVLTELGIPVDGILIDATIEVNMTYENPARSCFELATDVIYTPNDTLASNPDVDFQIVDGYLVEEATPDRYEYALIAANGEPQIFSLDYANNRILGRYTFGNLAPEDMGHYYVKPFVCFLSPTGNNVTRFVIDPAVHDPWFRIDPGEEPIELLTTKIPN